MEEKKAKQLAVLECQQWRYHHEKNTPRLKKAMIEYFKLLFDTTTERAKIAAQLTFDAFEFHDEAEKCKKKKEANVYWRKAIECLTERNMLLN